MGKIELIQEWQILISVEAGKCDVSTHVWYWGLRFQHKTSGRHIPVHNGR